CRRSSRGMEGRGLPVASRPERAHGPVRRRWTMRVWDRPSARTLAGDIHVFDIWTVTFTDSAGATTDAVTITTTSLGIGSVDSNGRFTLAAQIPASAVTGTGTVTGFQRLYYPPAHECSQS